MQVGLTDEQIQFRDMVARFLADKSPPSAVRTLMESSAGYDPDVWQQLAGELGLLGTHLPEAYGGFGFGPVELGLIAQQMGRHLYCGPFFASAVMAGYAVLNQADEQQKQRLLGDIAAGSTIAALVLDDLNAPERVGQHLVARGATISGEAPLVVDAQVANLLVVAARAADGLGLFVVDPAAGGVRVTPREVVDPTRKLCRVAFQDAPA